jgi:hypothetical protein
VGRLTGLKRLYLYDTKVTDAGLMHLAGLAQLELVILTGTGVTERGVEGLRKELPKVLGTR